MENEIIYYSDAVNDDFADTSIVKRPLPDNFKYHTRNPLVVIRRFIVYRCIVTPVIWIYNKLIRRIKYVNKKCMKGYKNRGCFMYGNHTMFVCDAFNPTYLSYPRRADVVVNSDATSIKGIRWLICDLGGLPIPEDFHKMKKFNDAVEESIRRKHWVAIYPEAHIWPYYNRIRPFTNVSFRYPVKTDAPVFTYTLTFKKRKHSKKPKFVVYMDGPFFPDKNLPFKQAVQKLRDEVYETMCARAEEHSDCEYKYSYVYKEQ